MSGGFNNPLVGGGGSLVYPSIHSPNFITGISGWSINKDGTAEFQNLIVRGTFLGTNFELTNKGIFFYSGVPAFGNLIYYISNVAGTDGHANPISVGAASLENVFGGQILLNGAKFQLSSGISVFITMDPGGINILNSFGAVVIRLDTAKDAIFVYLDNGSAVQGNLRTAICSVGGTDPIAGVTYSAGINNIDGTGNLRSIMNDASLVLEKIGGVLAPPQLNLNDTVNSNSLIATAGAQAFSVAGSTTIIRSKRNADVGQRWEIGEDGTMQWAFGGGAVFDSTFFPSGIGTLASDPIQGNIGGVGETPHSMAVRGYQNGWLDGGRQPGRYRIIASPPSTVELYGSLTIPVGFAVGQVIINLPNAYHPTNPQTIIGRNLSVAGALAALDYAANGNLTWQGATAASAAGNIIDFHGFAAL